VAPWIGRSTGGALDVEKIGEFQLIGEIVVLCATVLLDYTFSKSLEYFPALRVP